MNEQDFVALDDLGGRCSSLPCARTRWASPCRYKGKTIVLTLDQALASVSGRLISLPAPQSAGPAPARRWLVPVEFISRALALVYDARLDLPQAARGC